jgi:restriction endonuclease S subunit
MENRGEVAKKKGDIHGITHPGSTGVIYVMDRAKKNGYTSDDKEWSNFGQGAPEGNKLSEKKEGEGAIFFIHFVYKWVILMDVRKDLIKLKSLRKPTNMPLPVA